MKKILIALFVCSVALVGCKKKGCMDPAATNYDSTAKKDDGSCIFPQIGQSYQGGIIFYLDGNGGGLIASTSDQSTAAEWGCYGTLITGADGTAIGTGYQNTIDIVNANCSPYTSGNLIAADICANLTLGGYSDWFLPSISELNEMYLNKDSIGGFANSYYWSSTEFGNYGAWGQDLYNGYQDYNDKSDTAYVRAVRAF
jgi:hypothetical protein